MLRARTSRWLRRDGFFLYPDVSVFVWQSCFFLGTFLLFWIYFSLTLAVDWKLNELSKGGTVLISAKGLPWWFGFDYYWSWDLLKFIGCMWGLFNVLYVWRAQWLIFIPFEQPVVEFASTPFLWALRSRVPKPDCVFRLTDWFTPGRADHPKGRCLMLDLNGRRVLVLSGRSHQELLEKFSQELAPLSARAGLQILELAAEKGAGVDLLPEP